MNINTKLGQNLKLAEVATGLGTGNVRQPCLPLLGKERENVLANIMLNLKIRPTLPGYKNLLAFNLGVPVNGRAIR